MLTLYQNVALKPRFHWEAFLAVSNLPWSPTLRQGQGLTLWALIYPMRIPGEARTITCGVCYSLCPQGLTQTLAQRRGSINTVFVVTRGDCEPWELWADLSPNSVRQEVNVFRGIFQFSWTKTSKNCKNRMQSLFNRGTCWPSHSDNF